MHRHLLVTALIFASFPVCIRADEPAALYIFPAGGQRGTTVRARIGAMHLHESSPLHFEGQGLTADKSVTRTEKIWFEGPVIPQPDSQRNEDYPSDYLATIKLDATAQLGTRWWRVSNAQGVTPSMKFVVGDEPEIVENETDGAPLPENVALPLTINGRVFPREDVDLWRFNALRGQTIRCEVNAARLGSPLDSQLEILDNQGRLLASNSDHFGADSLIVFTAPADGAYQVRIRDAAFGGLQSYVYRLTLSSLPYVTSVYPLGARRGSTVDVLLGGVNVPAAPVKLAIPAEAPRDYAHRFKNGSQETNLVLLETSDVAETLEVEPNDEAKVAKEITLPGVANGRIDRAGDRDTWAFTADKGTTVDCDLRAARLDSPLDSVISVTDETGKELMRSDDLSGTETDSRLRFTAAAAGRYFITVEERYRQRGGPAFAYRLEMLSQAKPDFRLSLAVDHLTLYRDSTARLKVSVERLGGFVDPITLAFDGLPEGVTIANPTIGKNANDVTLNLKAEGVLPIKLHAITVRGTAKIGEDELTRVATRPVDRGEPELAKLWLGVSLPTPFKVVGVFQLPYAERGGRFQRHYSIERIGYDGPLDIALAEKQMRHLQGVTGPKIVVPAGANEFEYVVDLPAWMELSRTSRSLVTASATVDDGLGGKHRVCFTSAHQNEQISLIISAGPLTVAAQPSTIAPETERPVELDVRIERGTSVAGPVTVELVAPPHIRGVSAAPLVLSAGQSQGRVSLRFAADAGPFNMPLVLRATHGSGLDRAMAETPLEVVK